MPKRNAVPNQSINQSNFYNANFPGSVEPNWCSTAKSRKQLIMIMNIQLLPGSGYNETEVLTGSQGSDWLVFHQKFHEIVWCHTVKGLKVSTRTLYCILCLMGSQCSLWRTGVIGSCFDNQIQHELQCSELLASCSEEQQVSHTAVHFHFQYEISPRHKPVSQWQIVLNWFWLISKTLRKCAIAEQHVFLTCASMLSSWWKATARLRALGQQDSTITDVYLWHRNLAWQLRTCEHWKFCLFIIQHYLISCYHGSLQCRSVTCLLPLMLWNCFLDFAVEHWFGCCATEPGFAGDLGAIEVWLIYRLNVHPYFTQFEW